MSGTNGGLTLAGVFLCEAAAALLVGAAGRPLAGAACVAGALILVYRWLRSNRRRLEAMTQARLAAARAEALTESAAGRAERAIDVLEQARAEVPLDGPAARLLIELYAADDELTSAVQVALEHLPLLDPGDLRNMIASLEAWNEHQHAAALVFAVTIRRTAGARAYPTRLPI